MSSAPPVLNRNVLGKLARVHPTFWRAFCSRYAGDGTWKNAPHFDYLAERVLRMRESADRVRAGGEAGEQRLCVSLPPGFGKSSYLSYGVASWWLGTRPRDRVVVASYGKSLAVEFGEQARNSMAALGPEVFGVGADKREAAHFWQPRDLETGAAHPGYFYSVGRGGALTGKRGELIIIDDLLKDDQEAGSESIRNAAWNWFDKVAKTRQMPWTCMIMIGTRWHPDDPIGRLERKQKRGEVDLPWDFVNLPALAFEDDPLGRKPGESLWPAMWSTKRLEGVRRGSDPKTWSALYQGCPVPEGGSLFKSEWERLYEVRGRYLISGELKVPRGRLKVFSVADMAGSKKTRSDWTVITTWGIDHQTKTLWLLDLVRRRIEAPQIIETFKEVQQKWLPVSFYVERTGPQLNLVHALRIAEQAGEEYDPANVEQDVVMERALDAGVPVRKLEPVADKVERSAQAQVVMSNGRMLFPERADWLPVLLDELYEFPESKKDDQVDTISYAARVFLEVLAASD